MQPPRRQVRRCEPCGNILPDDHSGDRCRDCTTHPAGPIVSAAIYDLWDHGVRDLPAALERLEQLHGAGLTGEQVVEVLRSFATADSAT